MPFLSIGQMESSISSAFDPIQISTLRCSREKSLSANDILKAARGKLTALFRPHPTKLLQICSQSQGVKINLRHVEEFLNMLRKLRLKRINMI